MRGPAAPVPEGEAARRARKAVIGSDGDQAAVEQADILQPVEHLSDEAIDELDLHQVPLLVIPNDPRVAGPDAVAKAVLSAPTVLASRRKVLPGRVRQQDVGEVQGRSCLRRSDCVDEPPEVVDPLVVAAMRMGSCQVQVAGRACRSAVAPGEAAPGAGHGRQTFRPSFGRSEMEPDEGEIACEQLETLGERGPRRHRGQPVEVRWTERRHRFHGVDVMAGCKQREQVDRVVGADRELIAVRHLAGENRR